MKVLIVDDNSENRNILRHIIERQNNEVIEAEDGLDGLEKAAVHKPDLIISDVLMPKMDGFQLLRSIKKDACLKSIPFVFYSAVYNSSKDIELAESLGALTFIAKPKEPDKLWLEIKNALKTFKAKEEKVERKLFVEDEEFLESYSHIVAAKLEEKVKELEREIAWRKQAEARQYAQFSLTYIFAEFPTLREATPKLLQAICEGFGWDLGELWTVDRNADRLQLENMWYAPSLDASEFEKVSRKTTFSPGTGLPGRVWASGQPAVWITDVVTDSNFPRAPAASGVGLHGSVAFPLMKRGEVIGVMGFFSKQIRPLDNELFNVMADIGRRIGSFISRKTAEELLRASEYKYRLLLENLPQRIFHRDRNSVYVSCNENYAKDLKIKPDEIAGKTDYDFFPKGLAEKYRADDKRILESEQTEDIEEQYIKDGRTLTVHMVKTPIRDEKGNVLGIIGIFWDITERKQMESARNRLAAILEATTDFVGTADVDGRILYINKAGRKMLGIGEDEDVLNMSMADCHSILTWTVIREEGMPTAVREGVWVGETALLGSDGCEIPISQVVIAHKNPNGTVEYFSTIARDITDRKRFETQIVYLANQDPLTDLLNRRRFQTELESWLAQSRRYGVQGALLFLDLDNFKYINDTLGHQAGDRFLKTLAGLLKTRLRETDVLARLGGDEFAAVLPYVNETQAVSIASQLLELVRYHASLEKGQPLGITVSIGIALFPKHADTMETLLTYADLAMYRAKEEGRNRICVYTPEQKTQIESRLIWEKRIRESLCQDRFVLYLQPILDIHQNRIIGHEVLLRMINENGETVVPSNFLNIAERFGLIHDIDRWVVRRAIHLIEMLQQEGKSAYIEVNLSGKAFADAGLLSVIREELSTTGIDPKNLVFEITETAFVENMIAAQHFIAALKTLGCHFALDDFGIGFSSFSYLKHLPVDYLKIDGSFICNLLHDTVDQHLVRAIVEVARGLGKKTIAEFVESKETVCLLSEFGVDYAQGYYIGEPRPLSEI
ncbi:MAG: EAL domain-containing protein [Planctomycetes bacterium]|nr:EAL domain-containing protein [Planctomycetota bacterium]